MMNITIRVRSMVWVGEMQVGHKQFGRRMGWVMELRQMHFGGRTGGVTRGGNIVVKGRSPVWVRGKRRGE